MRKILCVLALLTSGVAAADTMYLNWGATITLAGSEIANVPHTTVPTDVQPICLGGWDRFQQGDKPVVRGHPKNGVTFNVLKACVSRAGFIKAVMDITVELGPWYSGDNSDAGNSRHVATLSKIVELPIGTSRMVPMATPVPGRIIENNAGAIATLFLTLPQGR